MTGKDHYQLLMDALAAVQSSMAGTATYKGLEAIEKRLIDAINDWPCEPKAEETTP